MSKLLEQMLVEHKENECMMNNLQRARDIERNRLISNILEQEEKSAMVVEHLLQLQNGPDPILIEKEQLEQDELLQKVNLFYIFIKNVRLISIYVCIIN